ncbi:MAG: thiamine phosphate synthase [Sphingobium sp.]|nr:MAG: thiamine phosphate synthase [Sphingobium sp.]
MPSRHRKTRPAPPHLWLMTDERVPDVRLIAAVRRLPRGAGIVFRHYALAEDRRRALFDRLARLARVRDVTLLLADTPARARQWGADGWHGPAASARGKEYRLHSMAVHDARELRAARRANADLLFISPVHPTHSHPDAATLGPRGLLRLARKAQAPVIALGGMTALRARPPMRAGIHGWAAIDALTRV